MEVAQKEIVLLPYPFSNFEGMKVRPAIIVSNDLLNKKSDDCIMIPLTTIIKNEPYSIIIDQNNLVSGKLPKQSRARTDKIFAVHKELIIMKIGLINDPTFEKIKAEIIKMF